MKASFPRSRSFYQLCHTLLLVNFSLIFVASDILEAGVKPEKHRLYILYGNYSIATNVRRYVALPQSRGGTCFCTRGAMQDCTVRYLFLALAKTVTPRGSPRREPGQAAPPTTKLSSLARKFSRYGRQLHIPTCYVPYFSSKFYIPHKAVVLQPYSQN